MPQAGFSMNDSTQCFRGNEVQFASTSKVKSGTLRYYWDFDDGRRDSGITVGNNYGTYRLYNPKHWIITDKACGDTLQKEVYIYPMPVSDFAINDTGQCLNQQSFYFEDVSLIPTGTIQRTWTFFDSSSSQTTITRSFPDDIRYQVRLIQES